MHEIASLGYAAGLSIIDGDIIDSHIKIMNEDRIKRVLTSKDKIFFFCGCNLIYQNTPITLQRTEDVALSTENW